MWKKGNTNHNTDGSMALQPATSYLSRGHLFCTRHHLHLLQSFKRSFQSRHETYWDYFVKQSCLQSLSHTGIYVLFSMICLTVLWPERGLVWKATAKHCEPVTVFPNIFQSIIVLEHSARLCQILLGYANAIVYGELSTCVFLHCLLLLSRCTGLHISTLASRPINSLVN